MKFRDIPNIISIVRILLVVPVVALILHGDYLAALLLFVIAGISDGIDGYLARQFAWQSRLGSILDPVADKLLLIATFVSLSQVGLISVWLVIAAISRDLIIVGGALLFHYRIGEYDLKPSYISKFNTFMQILLVVSVLSLQITQIPLWVIDWIVTLTIMTIILSGLNYSFIWGRKALQTTHKNNSDD